MRLQLGKSARCLHAHLAELNARHPQLASILEQLGLIGASAQFGLEAFTNVDSVRRTMRGFKISPRPRSRASWWPR